MYERSAVILERYFAEKFYYKDKSNLKNNYKNYCDLLENLEKYQEVAEAEDKIIKECEEVASQVKSVQRNHSNLYRKSLKLQEERNDLFESIDKTADELRKQLDKIETELEKNTEKMRPMDQEFIDAIANFNEKSDIRLECAKNRRKIEKEYRAVLEETTNTVKNIEPEKITEIKQIIASDDADLNEELKTIMLKNGKNEKVPFDSEVIENAIIFGQKILKQEVMLLIEIFNKTKNLLNDINNSAIKMKKYKKIAKDVKNKLNFINAQKEYLIQFLDNERLSVSLGKEEHNKLMKEACNDFNKDIKQIENLNKLLLAEISGKAPQKLYHELYSAEYLKGLQEKEDDFASKISELNLVGKILNPIYWRIEGLEKLYETFDNIVTTEYERDLSKFKIEDIIIEQTETDEEDDDDYNIEDEYDIQEDKLERPIDFIIFEDDEEDNEEDNEEDDSQDENIYEDDSDIEEDNLNDTDFEDFDFNEDELFEDDEVEEFESDEFRFEDNFYGKNENNFAEMEYEKIKDDINIEKEQLLHEETENDSASNEDDDDDFYDDEEEEDNFEDIEAILKNRRKRMGRNKMRKTGNKKSFWKTW